MSRILIGLLCSLIFISSTSFAAELDPALENEARHIFSIVMSPYCPGRLLQDCPSSQATELRDKIRGMLEEGQSREQVLEYLYGIYGQEISAIPEMRGFGSLAWLTPLLFLLGGALLLVIWIRRRKLQSEIIQIPKAPDSNMLKRIESEVSR